MREIDKLLEKMRSRVHLVRVYTDTSNSSIDYGHLTKFLPQRKVPHKYNVSDESDDEDPEVVLRRLKRR